MRLTRSSSPLHIFRENIDTLPKANGMINKIDQGDHSPKIDIKNKFSTVIASQNSTTKRNTV